MRTASTSLGTSLILTLLLLTPLAAAEYAPGTGVDKADYDHYAVPKFNDVALCFVDDDTDGAVDVGERLYLTYKTTTCTAVGGKYMRLVGSGTESGATKVDGSGDSDFDAPLTAVPAHAVRYMDKDGDGKLKKKDVAYLDLTGLGSATPSVSVGDVRLMAYGDLPAFEFVRNGDSDISNNLVELKGAVGDQVGSDAVADAQFGESGVFFEAGKSFYINADGSSADTAIEEGDVRVLKVPVPFTDMDIGAPEIEIVETTTVESSGVRLLTVLVRNVDDVTGAGLLTTTIDGVVVDARGTPTLAPGDEATLVIALPVATTADAEIKVATTDDPAEPEDKVEAEVVEPQNTPGFAPVLLVAALVGVALVLRRK